ncbi:MAG: HEAT repeat domain-containing protein [Deltaproteobacteria bacterium]|nr:HEAT repeat domain-containing protein [Deltaproteobacteria bacterium]
MNLLGLRAGEAKWVGAFAAYLGLVIGVVTLGRTTRDAVFLHAVGADALPMVYSASALATVLVAWGAARVARRFHGARLNVGCALGAAVALVGLYVASDGSAPFAWTLYLTTEAVGALLVVQCWSLLQDCVDVRQAKRLFGLVGAGGQVASIAAALLASELVGRAGVEALLLVGSGSAVGAAVLAWRLGARASHVESPSALNSESLSAAPFSNSHLRNIAVVSVLAGIVVHLVDFQFKSAASQHTAGDLVALGVFFGQFHAACAGLGLIVQVGLTSRVLQRLGTLGGALPLPISIGVASLASLVFPGLAAAMAAKLADLVFRYSLHDASTQLLYLPVPARQRTAAKAIIDGVLRPSTGVLAGVALPVVVAVAGPEHARVAVTLVVLGLVAVWCAAVLRGRRRYLEALALAISRRNVDTDLLQRSMTTRNAPGAQDVDVAAVADRLAREGREAMRAALTDPSAATRAAAVLALMRDGGLDGIIVAAEDLRCLIEADDDDDRALAAFVLGELRVPSLTPSLLEMLSASSERVRRAAVLAIGKHRDPRLGESLLALLADRDLAVDVVRALAVIGDEPLLGRALRREDVSWIVRMRVVALLGNGSVERAMPALIDALDGRTTSSSLDDSVRRGAVLGLQRFRARLPKQTIDVERLRAALDDETARAEVLLHARNALASWDDPAAAGALARAIDDEVDRSIAGSLRLLALLNPGKGLEALPRALAGTQVQRANAIEMIDTIAGGERNKRLVAIVEGRRVGPELVPTRSPAERLAALVTGAAPALARAAADLARAAPSPRLRGPLERAAGSSRADVRLAATAALEALGSSAAESG